MRAFAYRQGEDCSLHDLPRAAEAGDATLVEELLAAGAAVNEAAADGMTALMFAAASGKMEILFPLLARGADINVARKDGVTALALAAFFGHHQIVRELIARGADSATIGRFRAALEEWARERGWASVTREPMMEDNESDVGQGLPQQDVDLTDSIKTTEATKGKSPLSSDSGEELDWLGNSDAIDVSPGSLWAPDYEDQQPVPAHADRIEAPSEVNVAAETLRLSMAERIASARESPSAPVALPHKTVARPRLLDESAVLPGEASYATVALHQETIARAPWRGESALLPNEESYVPVPLPQETVARPRLLDESAVLPGEASYATIALHQKIAARSYSPTTEFLTKLFPSRRLGMSALITVAVSAAAIALFLKFSTVRGVFQSLLSENTTAATPVAPRKSSAVRRQVITPNSAKPVVASVSQQRADEPPPIIDASTLSKTVVAKSDVPEQPAAPEATKPRATSTRKPQPRRKESDRAKEAVVAGVAGASDSTSKKAVTTSEDPAGNSAASALSGKSSSGSQVMTSAGAERPRRVTPADPSQSQSVISPQPKNSKTKVIRWP